MLKALFHGLHFSAHSFLVLFGYTVVGCACDPTDHHSTTVNFFLDDPLIHALAKSKWLYLALV